jgi:hypothetical protein
MMIQNLNEGLPVSQDDEPRLTFRQFFAKVVEVDVLHFFSVGDDQFSLRIDLQDQGSGYRGTIEAKSLKSVAQTYLEKNRLIVLEGKFHFGGFLEPKIECVKEGVRVPRGLVDSIKLENID